METTELRSKEEIKRDIEATRKDTRRALRDAKAAWVTENPAVRAWKKTKSQARHTKLTVSDKVSATDYSIRAHIYQWIGGAALAGIVVGFLSRRRKARTKARAERCC